MRRSSGRKSKTSTRSDRLLTRLAKKHNYSSARELLNMWNIKVSVHTVYRRLRTSGLYRRRPLIAPLLTKQHRREREMWAMKKCAWRRAWDKVIFSDESRFRRMNNDRRVRVWRQAGERFNPSHIKAAIQGMGGSIHVWGSIWKGGRSKLIVLKENVN